ncbi:putative 3 5 -cyclic nucleotide phosphodiesterase [Rosellinia necatrix]|uniref:Phosphodiesterase n=1 Tax=Rosellinia necatrix TaxID=77044 RepID=A0A1W2TJS8_ROSNE|nr:putative 3 5 -cyclic nucleotide phosphodiesterase [Rosellinia necatrix]
MDSDTCNVIYVDQNVHKRRLLKLPTADLRETGELRANLELLLNAFGHVYLCTNGAECLETLIHLHDASIVDLRPTLVMIDTPHDAEPPEATPVSRDPSPHSKVTFDDNKADGLAKDLYGIGLLEKIVYETHLRSLSKLVVPIPVVSFPLLQTPPVIDGTDEEPSRPAYARYLSEPQDPSGNSLTSRALLRRCLDSGAVDIMASPLHVKTLTTLEVHAYRAHKEVVKDQQALLEIRRGRKRSWVGIHEEKPFAYLREAMVSGLMSGICRSGEESESRISAVRIDVSSKRRLEIEKAPGQWHFCAPCFDDDSLLITASLMFKHAFSMPELEKWRLPTDQLTTFLVACRAAYNQFVPYHNFRHAVDVLQATFDFLIHIGALPPYPYSPQSLPTTPKSQITSLLQPFEALTLLVSAIGHDVGHPGVNNGFLVVLNAPLAQLYNDRSVLESFHCAAYSQILRRHWPRVFEDKKMRSLMISSILATDMGMHFDYMKKLTELQQKLKAEPQLKEWSPRELEEQRALICSLLIKCADISNVARRYDAALQWMNILCDEFSRQAAMEEEIGIPSSLIAPPKKDFMSLAKAQLGFVNLFAVPLFKGVAEVLPQMQYTVIEIEKNTRHFESALEKIPGMTEESRKLFTQQPLDANIMKLVERLAMDEEHSPIETGNTELVSTLTNEAEMIEAGSAPPDKLSQVPDLPRHDPFHTAGHENRLIGHNGKQRSSDTTEGSNSVPCSGDWQSQATSATTGKMPLSPSTQGTSIVSQDSMDRPSSDPTTTVTAPDSSRTTTPIAAVDSAHASEEESNGTLKPDGTLKKKTSRFRMNVSTFFRRNKVRLDPIDEAKVLAPHRHDPVSMRNIRSHYDLKYYDTHQK